MRVAINAIIIQRGERILLTRKGIFWILPGGKPGEQEKDEACLRRELREELPGIAQLTLKGHYKNFRGKSPNKGDILEARTYFCSAQGDLTQTREGDSVLEARVVKKSELPTYNLSDITAKIVVSLITDRYL